MQWPIIDSANTYRLLPLDK